MEASMSFRSMNSREGQKALRGTGKAKRVLTQSQRDCGTEKELSETHLSLPRQFRKPALHLSSCATPHTSSPAKKRKREFKRQRDRRIQKRRVNIGVAFSRWKELMKENDFQRDAEVACFLLDRIDWAEEGPTFHGDPDDSSDDEYLQTIYLRLGGALKVAQVIDNLPTIGIDETVHDLPAPEVLSDEPLTLEQPGPQKVLSEDDIVGVRAAVIYENSLRQLVTFLTLPVDTCTGVLRNGWVCDSVAPFQTIIAIRGTAMSVEWVSLDSNFKSQ
ncbi:hypothetical protein N1851_011712 [Merluccius polli]|uniref:Uncharacterized protein n=1 Tax=Merluccius polli TaxID=89951 RepID=A0AA47MX47_MERPO|nr:hypothetical protein N1851_011712 [Merluccius polli]